MKKTKIAASLVVAAVLILGVLLYCAACPEKITSEPEADAYMEYANALVYQILTDSTELDAVSENHYRGNQLLLVTVCTGQYEGEQLMADNTVGPVYGQRYEVGQRVLPSS